jgi:hypothetical protein
MRSARDEMNPVKLYLIFLRKVKLYDPYLLFTSMSRILITFLTVTSCIRSIYYCV